MRQASKRIPDSAEKTVRDIRRNTRRHHSAEEKIRIGQLELSIGEFVEYYNNQRYHESLDNLTPVDVYFGRGPAILKWRESIKRKTIEQRRRLHQQAIAA